MKRPKLKSVRSTGSIDQDIGAAIKAARLERGITQQELAAKIGVTFQQLQKYETASNRISAARLIDIAGALGVTVGEFLPSAQGAPGAKISASELAKLISVFVRLPHADQQRVLDYATRLDDTA